MEWVTAGQGGKSLVSLFSSHLSRHTLSSPVAVWPGSRGQEPLVPMSNVREAEPVENSPAYDANMPARMVTEKVTISSRQGHSPREMLT